MSMREERQLQLRLAKQQQAGYAAEAEAAKARGEHFNAGACRANVVKLGHRIARLEARDA